MSYEKQDKCLDCGISIPHVDEGSDPAAALCDRCYGIERSYCLSCRKETMTESGQLCEQCKQRSTNEAPE